ncbi:uncharacterized protein LOC108740489 [Agrilus planipennis]|uniref:Uncharacterized protein LOC108740489 n=1 Tax=Agrilus planipennis TaxID=224129 RepID=A0A7F5RLU8_AGRPL|nr:uncharacterized protein LOC108740489 [Agrilus planipennis]
MTIVVSHAMRRYSPPSPSGNYFVHRVGEDSSCQSSPSTPSARHCDDHFPPPRSMRVSEPWLYGSVRSAPPARFFLTPALVLCTCAEYINGTKRSAKKSPTMCKKCKGTRLPFHMLEPLPPCANAASKYGTVRCYPTAPGPASGSIAYRAGTARVSSSSRPSILPNAGPDPYEYLRRARTSNSDPNSTISKRAKSPSKSLRNDTFSLRNQNISKNKYGTAGRKSILECEINPYDLVDGGDEGEVNEKTITFLNGQRIRVRPPLPEHDYEDVGSNKSKEPKKIQEMNELRRNSGSTKQDSQSSSSTLSIVSNGTAQQQQPYITPVSKTNGNDTYKSILKKTTFDSDNTNRSLAHRRSKSNFYLPNTVRKKVQFMDENEVVKHTDNNDYEPVRKQFDSKLSPPESSTSSSEELDEEVFKPHRVQRSISERFESQSSNVKFNDTMALRVKSRKKCNSSNFSSVLVSPSVDIALIKSFSKNIPSRPPPPLPPPKIEEVEEYNSPNEESIPKNNEETIKSNINFGGSLVVVSEDEEVHIKHDETPEEHTAYKQEECALKIVNELQYLPPPMAPPRKKNNKPTILNVINESTENTLPVPQEMERMLQRDKSEDIKEEVVIKTATLPPILSTSNKTVVQIRSAPDTYKIQIKNDYASSDIPDNICAIENVQRKTSIMINGDNCYSTVNVSDDTPLYLSSVVVSDANTKIIQTSNEQKEAEQLSILPNKFILNGNYENKSIVTVTCTPFIGDSHRLVESSTITKNENEELKESVTAEEKVVKPELLEQESFEQPAKEDKLLEQDNLEEKSAEITEEQIKQEQIQTREEYKVVYEDPEVEEKKLREILRNPVEAVKLNLVPHVCGKSDMTRRPLGKLTRCCSFTESSENCKSTDYEKYNHHRSTYFDELTANSTPKQDSSITSTDTGNSSMHYETMEQESDFYTDHSNRSSGGEDDSVVRSKFYELLADSAITELSETDDHQYESIKNNADPIYEEIEIPPPLPTSPPPKNIIDDLQLDKQITTRSIFEGASKYDILSYLVDAKERGIVPEDSYVFGNSEVVIEEETLKESNRGSHMSTISDSSEDSSLIIPCTFSDEKASYQKSAEVERNDSGVGSETSKVSLTKYRNKQESASNCEDCETSIEIQTESEALLCRKCMKRRSERKEIITEIVETEEKYSRDLQIILEEFYQPMLVAGLLTQDQLSAIFLNVEELLENSQALAERLRDAVEIAAEQGDEDLLTVNIGKLFLEAAPMLHAFETYCVRQAGASLLLASLEKDKELLRIFLRVSQMENTMLRRMNLNSFLMVPVQRVTKYPLLLARLHKATPAQHETKEQLMEAKHQIELHLNHMNSETKDVPSKLWRRIGSSSGRRLSTEMDLVSIKLRKIAVDVLEWNHEEARFALEGKLLFTQPTDNNWRKGRTIKLSPVNALLVTNGKNPFGNRPDRLEDDGLRFPKGSGIREAALLLVRDKNGRYSLLRDPLYLDRCVIATDPAWQSYFEVQEVIGKDTFIFKAEDEEMTQTWYKELQFHAQGLGIWRKRRNALANIMINGMGLRT